MTPPPVRQNPYSGTFRDTPKPPLERDRRTARGRCQCLIVFLDKGLLFGTRQTTVPIDKIISAVSGEMGMIFGKITINAVGVDAELQEKANISPFKADQTGASSRRASRRTTSRMCSPSTANRRPR